MVPPDILLPVIKLPFLYKTRKTFSDGLAGFETTCRLGLESRVSDKTVSDEETLAVPEPNDLRVNEVVAGDLALIWTCEDSLVFGIGLSKNSIGTAETQQGTR